ncbi:MAG: hypothetical protein Q4C87_05495 [Actinomycetaceae bacterium]|nr:hypothetical protein [Actinomycetaceae bacterium]
MPLFEFEEGRLIPAQFGHSITDGFTPELVDAICQQVLEIIARPLFPITWRDLTQMADVDDGVPRLTALDATAQVVSVEVVECLDSDVLISSLARLAETAALSWSDLAREYPGDIEGFKAGWLRFRDTMPPSAASGPRLIMVVGSIDETVRPALDVLAASGVEVHELSVREMSDGRALLDVQAVGPRLYGHAPQLLLGRSGNGRGGGAVPELAAALVSFDSEEEQRAVGEDNPPHTVQAPTRRVAEAPLDGAELGVIASDETGETGAHEAEPDQPAFDGTGFEQVTTAAQALGDTPLDMPDWDDDADAPTSAIRTDNAVLPPSQVPGLAPMPEGAKPAFTPVHHGDETSLTHQIADGHDFEGIVEAARLKGVPVLERDDSGLRTLCQILGEDVSLYADSMYGLPGGIVLAADGTIKVAGGGAHTSPDEAMAALGKTDLNGWDQWHLADGLGPTLGESLDEVNREMIREYERVPFSSAQRRH